MGIVKVFLLSAVLACSMMLSVNIFAFIQPSSVKQVSKNLNYPVFKKVLRSELTKVNKENTSTNFFSNFTENSNIEVSRDKINNAIRLISGGEIFSEQKTFSIVPQNKSYYLNVINSYLASSSSIIAVVKTDLRLNKSATYIGKDEQFFKFRVYRNNTLIQDAYVDFRFKFGKLIQIVNMSYAEITPVKDTAITDVDLEEVIAESISADSVELVGEKYRISVINKSYVMTKVSEYEAQTENGLVKVQANRATGEIFEVAPTKFFVSGTVSGQVYPRYYKDVLGVQAFSELHISTNNGSVTTDLEGNVTNVTSDMNPKIQALSGTRVTVNLKSGTKVTASDVVEDGDNWKIIWKTPSTQVAAYSDKNVAQSMLYVHTNKIINLAKKYIDDDWLNSPLVANANLTDSCNAHWDGSTINFYSADSRCANSGLIADIIYHEWGHGLDSNTGGIDDGAFSEGYGDIMSLLVTKSHVLGIGFLLDGGAVRDLEADKKYPDDKGSVHAEGLIIGSTFYDLFQSLTIEHGEKKAIDLLSNYAFKMIYTATNYTDVYHAILVIDDDNADLSDRTPNFCTINKVFTKHGLAESAVQQCSLAGLDNYKLDDSQGNNNGYIEPGETIKLTAVATNFSKNDLVDLNGTLSTDNADISVSESLLQFGNIAANEQKESETSAEFTIGENLTCGESFNTLISLKSGEKTANISQAFNIGKLISGEPLVYTATGLPKRVSLFGAAVGDIAVNTDDWNQDTVIHKAQLKFSLKVNNINGIVVELISPTGAKIEVAYVSGGDTLNFDKDITALLKGKKGKGAWKISAKLKGFSFNFGSLDSASLLLTPSKFTCE